ncbi:MAG: hypothetical protein U0324_36440 [Polyangiales bacterium]
MTNLSLRNASWAALLSLAACRPPAAVVTADIHATVTAARAPAPSPDASVTPPAAPAATLPAQGLLHYGVASAIARDAPGVDSLIAGNLRVEIAHEGGAVRIASEAPSSRLRWSWRLDGDRWAFLTSDQHVLVADTFLGPFTVRAAVPRSVVRHATGAVAAVRTDDGAWLRLEASGASPIASLPDGVMDVHFVDAQRAYAIRAPGELLASTDGGQAWQPVALPNDLAIRFEHDGSSALYVRGGRALYRVDAAGPVASTANTAEVPEVAPAVMERARARWQDHWRANHWPTGATHFAIEFEGAVVPALEVSGALFWARSGRVHRLGRDGATSDAAIDGAAGCDLQAFGANVLAHCDSVGEGAPARLVELDGRTLAQNLISDALNAITRVSAARDGDTIVFMRFPGPMTGPGAALWTRADPRIRFLVGAEPEARIVANGGRLLSIDRAWIRIASLAEPQPRFVDVGYREQGEDRFAPTELRAAHLREDGGYAVVRVSRGVRGCTVILGTSPAPSSMVRLAGCSDPTGVAFANDRFGVIVERTKAWVTRDGGDHWAAVARALGAVPEDAAALLERLPAPVIADGAIVLAPYQRIAEDGVAAEPAWAFRAAQMTLPRDEEEEPARHQGCFTDERAQVAPAPPPDPNTRRVTLLHQRTRATVTVRRDGVTVQWSGEDTGPGRYAGAAPWRQPEMDFDAGANVGYAIRGASRSGLLLERCLLEDGARVTHAPTACDVRWLRPVGAPVAIDLQNPPPEGLGAWVARAYPNGRGWVVELSSARRSLYFGWTQWQHLRADGTVERWGDVARDWALRANVQLARVGGAWGVIDDDGFTPHGGGERVEVGVASAPEFCAGAVRADGDVWVVTDGAVWARPAMGGGGEDGAVLRRAGDAWCVERVFERPSRFRWSTAASEADDAWSVGPGPRPAGGGVFRSVAAGGAVSTRRVTCDRIVEEQEE